MNSRVVKWLALFILFAISVVASLLLGNAALPASKAYACLVSQCPDELVSTIIWQIRLPRLMLGIFAGAALATAGAVLQNSTRNQLADPYLFGVVAGAAFGAVLYSLILEQQNDVGFAFACFLGSMIAILLVMGIGKILRQMHSLILVGVAVSFMLSAISHFILYISDPFATNRILFWLMGSLSRAQIEQLYFVVPIFIVSVVILLTISRSLDALMLGDENAKSLGVNIDLIRLLCWVTCAALTAVIVAYCGGISFVGLMIPHIARMYFGHTTAKLIVSSAIIGGIFIIWIDLFAKSVIAGQEIPLGVITGMIGSLFFLTLLSRQRHV